MLLQSILCWRALKHQSSTWISTEGAHPCVGIRHSVQLWVREHVISSAGCERESPVLSSLPGTEGRVAWGLEIRASAWTGTGFGPEQRTEIHHLCSLAQDPRVLNSTVVRCLIQLIEKELLHKQHPNHSLLNDSHRQPYGASPGTGKRVKTDAKAVEHEEQAQASMRVYWEDASLHCDSVYSWVKMRFVF